METIKGKDYNSIGSFEDRTEDYEYLKEYLRVYYTLPELSPFNLGLYLNENELKSLNYVGVVPLLKKNGEKENDATIIKISSRFGISPTMMLKKVLDGEDYYEHPDMLKTASYKSKEWLELGKNNKLSKDEKKTIFGLIDGMGKIDLSRSRSGDTEEVDESSIGVAEMVGAFEIIDFVNKAKEICKKSLKLKSERIEENLNCKVKGRILVQKQIKNNIARGQMQKMYCAYNRMSPNNKENQILKYALHLCQKEKIGDSLSEDISFCMNSLSGVPLKKCSNSDFLGLKNNGAYRLYKEALQAAQKVINRYSISYEDSSEEGGKKVKATLNNYKVLPHYINMNLLFEFYCRALVREAIDEFNKGKTQIKFLLEETGEKRNIFRDNSRASQFYMKEYVPDLVIKYTRENEEKTRIAAVIDAKYSDVEERWSESKRAHTHQVLFYMKMLGCDVGGLISPSARGEDKGLKEKELHPYYFENINEDKVISRDNTLCYIPLYYEACSNDDKEIDIERRYIKNICLFLNQLSEMIIKDKESEKLRLLEYLNDNYDKLSAMKMTSGHKEFLSDIKKMMDRINEVKEKNDYE